jgi:glutamine amidotransferase
MKRSKVAVVDYGIGNLLSVSRALIHCDAEVAVTCDPEVILSSSHVILPGVGAFPNAMLELSRQGLDKVVKEVAIKGTPLLGICLGMHMLLDQSEEFGLTAGLGLIPGRVVPLSKHNEDGSEQKIPHIGWSALYPANHKNWKNSILQDINEGEAFYFVHSFVANLSSESDLLAQSVYGMNKVPAVISRCNVMGCQFHPEKSGRNGLNILQNFLQL